MTSPLSTKQDIGVSISIPRRFLRKAIIVSDKTLIVIPPELVKSLHINEDTWIEETEADNGISLTIYDMHEQKKDSDEHFK